MFRYKKIFFKLTEIKILLIRIISGFIINRNKRRIFRDKLFLKHKKKYLKNYLYALNNKEENLKTNNKHKLSNIIWVCWFQKEENAPDIIKVCIESIRKYKPKNMEVIVLNENTIKNYIKFPDYILTKRKKGIIKNAQYSDLLRIALLSTYGGMWIDSTVLLTDQLPKDITNPDFFSLHSIEKGKHNNSWFLTSEPNNILINSIKKLMFEYWKYETKMLDYFLYHLFFDLMIENNTKLKEKWKEVPIYWDYNSYKYMPIILNEYNKNKAEEIESYPFHKLTYRYNKNKNIRKTFLEKIFKQYNIL